ncbi:MAG: TetR/AcrR family transcriptional regulator [Clostridia bacterium]|nr:TetR/AcrR family transcriptional regulator [Lachnospiraceae bacterium]NCC00309.1 TetR/AcrR family transcriptional regulator [Clostridia bacterium]NCD04094.1 TetR/AcrR family transcriptional regulator [Clostridia bacterium]
MTTKERIAEEALNLFSVKGFRGTSVKNIADAVGIKDSSLYKHYKSKKEIFDGIVLEMRKRMENMSQYIGLPDDSDIQASARMYGELTLENLLELSRKIFLFYLTDDFISKFWRVATMEQYQNEEIYDIFRHIFMEESITYQTLVFREMIRNGIFIEVNPEVIAINFYTPIFFLLSKYNGRAEGKAEGLEILENQIKEFYRIYRKKNV